MPIEIKECHRSKNVKKITNFKLVSSQKTHYKNLTGCSGDAISSMTSTSAGCAGGVAFFTPSTITIIPGSATAVSATLEVGPSNFEQFSYMGDG